MKGNFYKCEARGKFCTADNPSSITQNRELDIRKSNSDEDMNIHKAEMLLECIKLCRTSLNDDMLRVFAHEFLHLLLSNTRFNIDMSDLHD